MTWFGRSSSPSSPHPPPSLPSVSTASFSAAPLLVPPTSTPPPVVSHTLGREGSSFKASRRSTRSTSLSIHPPPPSPPLSSTRQRGDDQMAPSSPHERRASREGHPHPTSRAAGPPPKKQPQSAGAAPSSAPSATPFTGESAKGGFLNSFFSRASKSTPTAEPSSSSSSFASASSTSSSSHAHHPPRAGRSGVEPKHRLPPTTTSAGSSTSTYPHPLIPGLPPTSAPALLHKRSVSAVSAPTEDQHQTDQAKRFDTVDSKHLLAGLLDGAESEQGSASGWGNGANLESYATALAARMAKARSFDELFASLPSTSSSSSPVPPTPSLPLKPSILSTSPTPSTSTIHQLPSAPIESTTPRPPSSMPIPPPLPVFDVQTHFLDSILKVASIFSHRASPISIRLAGLNLLTTLLRTSKRLLPARSIASIQLSVVLDIIVSRSREDGLEDMSTRVECMRLLVAGGGGAVGVEDEGKSGWNWDGWGDWARVLTALRAWEEELETAWSSEVAAGEMLTELPSPTQSSESYLPTLLGLLSVLESIVSAQTSFFSSQDRSDIVALFARLAWHGLDITNAPTESLPFEQIETLVSPTPIAGSQLRRTSEGSEALGGLGLDSGKPSIFAGASRGRAPTFWSASSTASSLASVSRSPSISRKAQATVSTSTAVFGSPAPSGRSAPSAGSTPSRPGPSSAFISTLGHISQNPSHILPGPPETFKPFDSLHPLCGAFLTLFASLARAALAPGSTIGPSARLMFAMLNAGGESKDKAFEVLLALFGKGSSARFNQVLGQVLAGMGVKDKEKSMQWGEAESAEEKVVRGAVVCIRLTLHQAYFFRRASSQPQDLSSSIASLPAQSSLSANKDIENLRLTDFDALLRSAMAKSRCKSEEERERWVWVDQEVLKVVEEVLQDSKESGGMDAVLGEGNVVVSMLAEAAGWVEVFRFPEGTPFHLRRHCELVENPELERPDTPYILKLYGQLHRALPRCLQQYLEKKDPNAEVRLSRAHAALLIDLAAYNSEIVALLVIKTYMELDLCIPSHPDWIGNLSSLARAYYDPPADFPVRDYPAARESIAALLFQHVFARIKLDPEQRPELVDKIILPLLETSLEREKDSGIEETAWKVLVESAVLETLEMDDETEVVVPGDGFSTPIVPESRAFERIRALLKKVASGSSCGAHNFRSQLESRLAEMSSPRSQHFSPVLGLSPPTTTDADLPPLSLSALMSKDPLSPISPSVSAGPNLSRRSSNTPIPTPTRSSTGTPMPEPPSHARCKSLRASKSLIAIFSRLTFSSQRLESDRRRKGISIASTRSIVLFHDILALVRPYSSSSSSTSPTTTTTTRMSLDELQRPELHASCPRARLSLLQWLVRLRADTQHRVWITTRVDASYAAPILGRGSRDPVPGSSSRPVAPVEPERRRPSRFAPPPEQDERGRNVSRQGRRDTSRPGRRDVSRSRSRMPEPGSSRDVVEHPMWFDGDAPDFELPTDTTPSPSMNTFDPTRNFVQTLDLSLLPHGVWLPVSEYIKVIVEILSEEAADWELVSFILCYFPLQLVNQHFFCGPRAKAELRVFVDQLTKWLGPSGQLPITRKLPSSAGLRKSDVHAVAYQTLDVLVSYYRQFQPQQHRSVVRAFQTGISASDWMGKACIQALTMMATMAKEGSSKDVALVDFSMAVTKDLPEIMEKLGKLTSNVSLAIHILEFVYAVSQNPNLYINFTSEQYRLPFAVALNIIRIHHESVSDSSTADIPTKVLSLHMLQYAYFVMYPWFLNVPVQTRPDLARHILDQLTSAKQTLEEEDERSEVCMDFLHRYSYSSADPKPASSFLAELALPPLEDGATESRDVNAKIWSVGNAAIRIKANKRSGWAQVETFRPSGTTTMIVKVENIPVIDIGNANADTNTSAALLLDGLPTGKEVMLGEGKGEESSIDPADLNKLIRQDNTPADFKTSSDVAEFVWSGSAPSQRRKTVTVDPSYIAQQYFAYPSIEFADRPRLVKDQSSIKRINNLDENLQVIDLHKIGVLYVGPGQTTQHEIMENVDGSQNYTRFLHGLGNVVKLEGQKDVMTGLDTTSARENGKYTYAFWDDIHVTSFHIATLMPNLASDPDFDNKVKCIGNDFVRIVFNDSGQDYRFDTISTAFQYCNIVISPHTTVASRTHQDPDEHNFFKVIVQRAEDVPEFGPVGQFKIISAASLPTFIRQLALTANLICKLFGEVRDGADNSTSWRARLMRLKQIRNIAIKNEAREHPRPSDPHEAEVFSRDFTVNL